MRWTVILMFAVIAACSSEPDFDERYDRAEEEIRDKAAELDKDLRAGPDRDVAVEIRSPSE